MRSVVWVAVLVTTLSSSDANAEASLAVCYATSDNFECGTGSNNERVVEYARSQCGFWSKVKNCREVVRCSQPGWFVVVYAKNDSSFRSQCGAANREQALSWAKSTCGSHCDLELAQWLGPPKRQPAPGVEGPTVTKTPPSVQEEDRRSPEERPFGESRPQTDKPQPAVKPKGEAPPQAAKPKGGSPPQAGKPKGGSPPQTDKPAPGSGQRPASSQGGKKVNHGGGVDPEMANKARGFQQLNEAIANNRAIGAGAAAGAAALFSIEGGSAATTGSTRRFVLDLGFGGRYLPVMSNSDGTSTIEPLSKEDHGGGLGFDLEVEFWPLYRRYFGLGVQATGAVHGFAMPAGAIYIASGGGGVRGYLGSRSGLALGGEATLLATVVGTTGYYFGAKIAGSGTYSVTRLGVGPRLCIRSSPAKGHCMRVLSADVLFDRLLDRSAMMFRISVEGESRWFGSLGLSAELSLDYPAPGSTRYPLDDDERDRRAIGGSLFVRKSWAWHGGGAKPTCKPGEVGCPAI